MVLKQIGGPVVLDIPSDPAALFMVRRLVETTAERMGFARDTRDRLVLAVDEACTNVIRHAYDLRPDERIVITFNVCEDRLEILIRDFGARADPQNFKSRDLSDIRPGGLGMHLIRSTIDEVQYECQADGGTLLKMVKFRTVDGPEHL